MKAFVDAGVAELGRLDIVEATAGICIPGDLGRDDPRDVSRQARGHGHDPGFAAELGKHRIRVNSVHPAAVATPMDSGDMVTEITRTNESNPPLALMGTALLPQGWVKVEEIADAVAFGVSDDARFITAEHLSIDAGAHYY